MFNNRNIYYNGPGGRRCGRIWVSGEAKGTPLIHNGSDLSIGAIEGFHYNGKDYVPAPGYVYPNAIRKGWNFESDPVYGRQYQLLMPDGTGDKLKAYGRPYVKGTYLAGAIQRVVNSPQWYHTYEGNYLQFQLRKGPTFTMDPMPSMQEPGETYYRKVVMNNTGHSLGNRIQEGGMSMENIPYSSNPMDNVIIPTYTEYKLIFNAGMDYNHLYSGYEDYDDVWDVEGVNLNAFYHIAHNPDMNNLMIHIDQFIKDIKEAFDYLMNLNNGSFNNPVFKFPTLRTKLRETIGNFDFLHPDWDYVIVPAAFAQTSSANHRLTKSLAKISGGGDLIIPNGYDDTDYSLSDYLAPRTPEYLYDGGYISSDCTIIDKDETPTPYYRRTDSQRAMYTNPHYARFDQAPPSSPPYPTHSYWQVSPNIKTYYRMQAYAPMNYISPGSNTGPNAYQKWSNIQLENIRLQLMVNCLAETGSSWINNTGYFPGLVMMDSYNNVHVELPIWRLEKLDIRDNFPISYS